MTAVIPSTIRFTGRDEIGNFKRTLAEFHTATAGPAIASNDEVTGRFTDMMPLVSTGKRMPPRGIIAIEAKADVAATAAPAESVWHIPITLWPINGGPPIYRLLYKGNADMNFNNFASTALGVDTFTEMASYQIDFGYEADIGYVIDGVDIWQRGQGNNGARAFCYLGTA